MTIDDKIRDEKLQYNINREAVKKSALSSGKLINMNFLQVKKYYLLIKERWWNKLSLTRRRLCPLEKSFETQTKIIEDQEEKQIKALEEHGKQPIKSSNEKDV